jgi:predicted DNA-binding transcriptional regulator YafY
MRADRLISIILLLQVHPRLTARVLARRLEVSERTVHRDMESLSAAGIPVVAERGAGGGWSLLGGYRTKLNGLNPSEIQVLFMTRPAQLLSDLGLDKVSEAANLMLLAALPAYARQGADYARQRIHIDVAGWRNTQERVPHLPALQEAVWQECRVRLTYQRGDGIVVERLIDPLGLVAKGSVWYLVAAVEGELRSYRISRVLGVTPTGEPCIRPEPFDLAAYWEQSQVDFRVNLPLFPVMVLAAPGAIDHLLRSGRYVQLQSSELLERDNAAGWIRTHLSFQAEWEAVEYLIGLGPKVIVLEPDSVREKIVALAEAVLAHYAAPLIPYSVEAARSRAM